jgi:hypothetical protein
MGATVFHGKELAAKVEHDCRLTVWQEDQFADAWSQ